jgi:MOSC domain-containing protein YiiM
LYVRVIQEGIIKAGDPVTVEKFTGETISIVEMYREYYVKDKSEESLRKHLNAPIDIRSRRDLEEELQKLTT